MKKSTIKTAAFATICAVTLLTTSCKKNETVTPEEETPIVTQPTTIDNSKVKALLTNFAKPLQSFNINASTYNTITLLNGTKITTYPNAFLTQSGAVVTGVVVIEAKDVLTKKDMILNNALPVSNGELLVSGGEVYFNATQNGQKLKINPSSSVIIKVPAGNSPSTQMKEFYAQGTAELSNTNLNWLTVNDTITPVFDSTAVGTGTVLPGGGGNYYYNFDSDSIGWTNCDYFSSFAGAKTTCTVNLTSNFDNSNSTVFISKNGVNTLARLNSSYSSISQAFVSYQNSIPVGSMYTIIAISFDGTNYFYASQAITMTVDMVITMPALTQMTKAQIETQLGLLP